MNGGQGPTTRRLACLDLVVHQKVQLESTDTAEDHAKGVNRDEGLQKSPRSSSELPQGGTDTSEPLEQLNRTGNITINRHQKEWRKVRANGIGMKVDATTEEGPETQLEQSVDPFLERPADLWRYWMVINTFPLTNTLPLTNTFPLCADRAAEHLFD